MIPTPPMRMLPAHDRPRERLLREGSHALSDAELVAILLGTGGRGRNAVALAQDVLARCGGVAGLARRASPNSRAWTPWAPRRRPVWLWLWRWPDASGRPRSVPA